MMFFIFFSLNKNHNRFYSKLKTETALTIFYMQISPEGAAAAAAAVVAVVLFITNFLCRFKYSILLYCIYKIFFWLGFCHILHFLLLINLMM